MTLLSTACQGCLNLRPTAQTVIRLKFLSCLIECTSTLHSTADGRVPAGGNLYDFEWSNHYVDTTYSRTGLTKLR